MAIADKYTAFSKALQELQILDLQQYAALSNDQARWTGTYTPEMKNDVNLVRQHGFPRNAAAIEAFWSDPGAWKYEQALASGAATAVGQTLAGIPRAAAAVGQTGQNVAGSVGKGLTFPGFLTGLINPHTWLRIGEAIMGLMLLGIGVSIMAKSSPTGAAVVKTAKGVIK